MHCFRRRFWLLPTWVYAAVLNNNSCAEMSNLRCAEFAIERRKDTAICCKSDTSLCLMVSSKVHNPNCRAIMRFTRRTQSLRTFRRRSWLYSHPCSILKNDSLRTKSLNSCCAGFVTEGGDFYCCSIQASLLGRVAVSVFQIYNCS